MRPIEPITQESCVFFEDHAIFDDEEVQVQSVDGGARIAEALGSNRAVILRNHGLLTTGPTIPDAFLMMYALETACQIQLAAQSTGGELIHVPDPIVEGMQAQAEEVLQGLGGQLAWPGILRKLDRRDASFRD